MSEPVSTNNTYLGNYFIGHTPPLLFGCRVAAWGGLINPADSGVNMYLDTIVISNLSSNNFIAQVWLNATPTGFIQKSTHVTAADTTVAPLPTAEVELSYARNVRTFPSNGTSLYTRIVEAYDTAVADFNSIIAVPPGGSLLVYLLSPNRQRSKAEVAFGWCEYEVA